MSTNQYILFYTLLFSSTSFGQSNFKPISNNPYRLSNNYLCSSIKYLGITVDSFLWFWEKYKGFMATTEKKQSISLKDCNQYSKQRF